MSPSSLFFPSVQVGDKCHMVPLVQDSSNKCHMDGPVQDGNKWLSMFFQEKQKAIFIVFLNNYVIHRFYQLFMYTYIMASFTL